MFHRVFFLFFFIENLSFVFPIFIQLELIWVVRNLVCHCSLYMWWLVAAGRRWWVISEEERKLGI
ncbi:hypothetical protein Lalb_Chr11g0073751 [Lupinus albus]|uniref:Uncharacterized protein n=1 Tax=Lupinus albus TaxID=3870 RepID=A0A6A4PSH9_LUPAL|nr:hypothetical protein Lalb_Chr11g0073751 [Lupinus albus]